MNVKSLFRFAHISDLHFSSLFFTPTQFFSKRWVGNLNLLLNRKKNFEHKSLYSLIPLFQELKVDAVLLTGDLTTTSHEVEFEMAKQFIDALESAKLRVFCIPGNHDHYTRSAYRNQHFYRYFNIMHHASDAKSFFKLKEDKVCVTHLGKQWWLIALDSSLATSLFSSHGVFSEQIQAKLEHALSFLPPDQKIIMLNHFPFFDEENKNALHRADALRSILQRHKQIKLYLHGHTHRHIVADLRPSDLPIVIDSGCTAQKKGGTWNLIDITQEGCEVSAYKKGNADNPWEMKSQSNFVW
jgi:3',5'-cyclic AMP phosphodiesterase CpdA